MSDVADLLRRAAEHLLANIDSMGGCGHLGCAGCPPGSDDFRRHLAAWLRTEANSAAVVEAYDASIGKADDPDMAGKTAERHQHPLALATVILGEGG